MRAVFHAPSTESISYILVLVLLVAHLVEDEEFGLNSRRRRPALIPSWRTPGLAGDMTRVAREVLTCYGVDDIGDNTDRGSGEEWIEAHGVGVGGPPSCPTHECPSIPELTTRRIPDPPRKSPRPKFRSERSNAATTRAGRRTSHPPSRFGVSLQRRRSRRPSYVYFQKKTTALSRPPRVSRQQSAWENLVGAACQDLRAFIEQASRVKSSWRPSAIRSGYTETINRQPWASVRVLAAVLRCER